MSERKVRMGIDVGGTHTKAVAIDNATHEIIGKSSVKTTHDDKAGVATGVVQAFKNCLKENDIDPKDVIFVAHSTTQATNALIEGDVAQVGVIGIGGKGPGGWIAKAQTNLKDIDLGSGRSIHLHNRYLVDDTLSDASVKAAIQELTGEGAQVIVASEVYGVDDMENETGVCGIAKNLVGSCLAAVLAQLAGVCLFDFSVIGHLPQVDWEVRSGRVGLLFKENVVLFLSVILDFYIFSAAKYAIEGNMADKYQAVFGAIFMPTSVINLVAGFVIRPYITKLSDQWERNALPEFAGTIGRLAAIIAALTVLAVGGAWILGIPVLSILYPKIAYMLRECRLALVFIILGGAFNAYVNLFYYALIIMQEQKRIFLGYVGVTAAALLISSPCVRAAGLLGGSLSYLLLMAALTACFGLTSLVMYRRRARGI